MMRSVWPRVSPIASPASTCPRGSETTPARTISLTMTLL
jgi:hypothetical protein